MPSFLSRVILLAVCLCAAAAWEARSASATRAVHVIIALPEATGSHAKAHASLPAVKERLAAAAVSGISDYLFEACVVKALPAGRVDPALRRRVAYRTPAGHAMRLANLVRDAVTRESERLARESGVAPRDIVSDVSVAETYAPSPQVYARFAALLAGILDATRRGCLKGKDARQAVRPLIDAIARGDLRFIRAAPLSGP